MGCTSGFARVIGLAGVFLLAAGISACSKKPQQMAIGQEAGGPVANRKTRAIATPSFGSDPAWSPLIN